MVHVIDDLEPPITCADESSLRIFKGLAVGKQVRWSLRIGEVGTQADPLNSGGSRDGSKIENRRHDVDAPHLLPDPGSLANPGRIPHKEDGMELLIVEAK